jgi:hypothetical protein
MSGTGRDLGVRELDPLVGYEWRLVAVERTSAGGDDVAPADAAVYTLKLLESGEVEVHADCNQGHGRWTRDGAKLSFPGLELTHQDCGVESLFEDVARGLRAVDGYRFRDGHLFLLEHGSNELLEYEPTDDDPIGPS